MLRYVIGTGNEAHRSFLVTPSTFDGFFTSTTDVEKAARFVTATEAARFLAQHAYEHGRRMGRASGRRSDFTDCRWTIFSVEIPDPILRRV